MTAPTTELTWQHNVNQITGEATDVNKQALKIMYDLKQTLVSFPINPWTVSKSSNGSVANSSDNWTSLTTMKRNGGENMSYNYDGSHFSGTPWQALPAAHSWIVLSNSSGAQLLLDCTDYSEQFKIYFSPSGSFNNTYSTSLIPTASDSISIKTNNYWGASNIGKLSYLHVLHDTSGKHTRILICKLGNCYCFAGFDSVTPSPGITWNSPNVAFWNAHFTTAGFAGSSAQILDSTIIKGWYNGALVSMSPSVETWAGSRVDTLSTVLSSTNTWALGSLTGLWSSDGKMAIPTNSNCSVLPDIFLASSTNPVGSTYTNIAGQQQGWAQFGSLIVPWNNSIVSVT